MRAVFEPETTDICQAASESGADGIVGEVLSYPGWNGALNRLQSVLGQDGAAILVGLPGVGKSAMLGLLAAEATAGTGPRRRRTIAPLLLDDAEYLSHEAFEAALRGHGAVVLAGQHGLVERLSRQRRAVSVIELPPLQPDDYPDLLGAMLRKLGEPASLLPPALAVPLGRHAGGRAGSLVALARLAIFLARLEGVETVQSRHLEEAAAVTTGVELQKPEADPDMAVPPAVQDRAAPPRSRRWLGRLMVTTAVACILPLPVQRQNAIQRPSPSPPPAEAQPPPALPAAAPAPPLLPLPDPMLHVSIAVPANDPAALARGQQIAVMLRQAGYAVSQPVIAGSVPSRSGVRYFYLPDRLAASVLAAFLGNANPVLVAGPGRAQTGRAQSGPADLPRPGSAEVAVAPSNVFPALRTATDISGRVP